MLWAKFPSQHASAIGRPALMSISVEPEKHRFQAMPALPKWIHLRAESAFLSLQYEYPNSTSRAVLWSSGACQEEMSQVTPLIPSLEQVSEVFCWGEN